MSGRYPRGAVTAIALACVALVAVALPAAAVDGTTTTTTPAAIATPSVYVVSLRGVQPGSESQAAASIASPLGGRVLQVYHVACPASRSSRAGAPRRLAREPACRGGRSRRSGARRDDTTGPVVGPGSHRSAHAAARPGVLVRHDRRVSARAYIVDSGIRFDHAAFGTRASLGVDVVGDGRLGVDCNGHGTAVAGIVGGVDDGVAKQVSLVAVRVLDCDGQGTTSRLLAGIDWIAAHSERPAVVNLALTTPPSALLDGAIEHLVSAGVTVVAAAGNDNEDACARVAGACAGGGDGRSHRRDRRACDLLELWPLRGSVRAWRRRAGADHRLDDLGRDGERDIGRGGRCRRRGGALPPGRRRGFGPRGRDGVDRAGEPGGPRPWAAEPDRLLYVDPVDVPGVTPPTSTVPSTTTTPSTATPNTAAPSTTAGPAASPGDGSAPVNAASGTGINTFVRGTDGALWWRQLTDLGWSAWQSFGGSIVSTPSVVAGPSGHVYVFVRGADNALWWQGYDGSRWTGWQSFGGILTSDPSAFSDGSNIWVFVRGGDAALYFQRLPDGGSWSGWVNGGGVLASRVAVTADSSGVVVFVRGGDNGLWGERASSASSRRAGDRSVASSSTIPQR